MHTNGLVNSSVQCRSLHTVSVNDSILLYSGVTISLQQYAYTVGEGDGVVHVCAEIVSGQIERDVTVYLNVEEYTAMGKCTHQISQNTLVTMDVFLSCSWCGL